MNRRKTVIGIFIFIFVLIGGGIGFAQDMEDEQLFEIKEDEIVRRDLITKRDTINNRGVIVGDILAISKNINNWGLVHGDVLALGKSIFIEGIVKGDIRSWTNSLKIKGEINRNILLITRNLLIEDKGVVDGSITIIGERVIINGALGGDLRGSVDSLIINGEIKGDVNVSVKDLKLGAKSKIGGDLRYQGPKATDINQGYIGGDIKFTRASPPLKLNDIKKIIKAIYLILRISFKVGLYILGILFVVIFPEEAKRIHTTFKKEELKIPIMGICYLIIVPAICAILFITILGVSIGIITALFYTCTLYLAKIPVAISIGKIMLKNRFKDLVALILGLIIIDLLCLIPYINTIVSLLTVIIGTGIVIYSFLKAKDFHSIDNQFFTK